MSARAECRAQACPRCLVAANITAKDAVCSRCRSLLMDQARAQQEASYIHVYLHTRADEVNPTVKRLRQSAAAEGIDWRRSPPKPVAFADRVAALMAPFRHALPPDREKASA